RPASRQGQRGFLPADLQGCRDPRLVVLSDPWLAAHHRADRLGRHPGQPGGDEAHRAGRGGGRGVRGAAGPGRQPAEDPDRPVALTARACGKISAPARPGPCYGRAGLWEEPMRGMPDTGTHVLEVIRVAEGETSPRRDADVLA